MTGTTNQSTKDLSNTTKMILRFVTHEKVREYESKGGGLPAHWKAPTTVGGLLLWKSITEGTCHGRRETNDADRHGPRQCR